MAFNDCLEAEYDINAEGVDDSDEYSIEYTPKGVHRSLSKTKGKLSTMGGNQGKKPRATKPHRQTLCAQQLPLKMYMQNPPAGTVVKKLGLMQALQLIYCCYGRKFESEIEEANNGNLDHGSVVQKKSIAEYIQEILVQRYGLLSITDEYLYGLVNAIQKYYMKSQRLELFGSICGILDSHKYSPTVFNTFCSLLRISCRTVPDIVSFLRNYPEDACWVPVNDVVKAIHKTFPPIENKIENAKDVGLLYLSMEKRTKVWP